MEFLRGLAWILAFYAAGEALARLSPIPAPGAVAGLLLFYVALRLGLVRAEWVREGARGLLSALGLLFVPVGAGVASLPGVVSPALLAAVALLTALSLAAVGGAAQAGRAS